MPQTQVHWGLCAVFTVLLCSVVSRQVELAVIYQNRGAAQERLEHLEEATQDCDASIK